MCLWNTDAPGGNKVEIWQNLLVKHFDPAPLQGYVMSGKCEQPSDELTVQVWLLYDHPNYCKTLIIRVTLFSRSNHQWFIHETLVSGFAISSSITLMEGIIGEDFTRK